jgi:hypothetical protein
MSKAMEKMLRRMIAPNADMRCVASDAMDDPYWTGKDVARPAHRSFLSSFCLNQYILIAMMSREISQSLSSRILRY